MSVSTLESIDVLVIGSCMTDLTAYASRLPKPGETIHGKKFSIGFGGKGANQCIAATKLGASSAMVTKLGNDSFGQNYYQNFLNLKVNTTYVKMVENTSGIAQILVSDEGENHIVIVAGANNDLTSSDTEEAEDFIKRAKVVIFQFEIPLETTLRALEICAKYSCTTIVNGAPGVSDLNPKILKLADIFCVNETEAELITKCEMKDILKDAFKAAISLKSMGCKLPLITIGDKGAIFIPAIDNCAPVHVPLEPVKAIDTTGAGDAFIGALAFFLAKFKKLAFYEVVKRSCEVAKYSVRRMGTQTSFPSREQLPQILFEE